MDNTNRFHFQAYSVSNGNDLPPFHLLNFFASDSFCGSLILTSNEFSSFKDFLSHSGIEVNSDRSG